jgi:hypothetical protein
VLGNAGGHVGRNDGRAGGTRCGRAAAVLRYPLGFTARVQRRFGPGSARQRSRGPTSMLRPARVRSSEQVRGLPGRVRVRRSLGCRSPCRHLPTTPTTTRPSVRRTETRSSTLPAGAHSARSSSPAPTKGSPRWVSAFGPGCRSGSSPLTAPAPEAGSSSTSRTAGNASRRSQTHLVEGFQRHPPRALR